MPTLFSIDVTAGESSADVKLRSVFRKTAKKQSRAMPQIGTIDKSGAKEP